MQKKFIITLLILIVTIVGISGCTLFKKNSGNGSVNLTTFAENGITFNYPSKWTEYDTKYANEIVRLGNLSNSTSNGGKEGVMFIVYKDNSTEVSVTDSISKIKDDINARLSGTNITESTKLIDGVNATLITDLETYQGVNYKSGYLIFEKNGYTYSIYYFTSPTELFDQNNAIFQNIFRSFHIT
jgi:hypothetical protein